MILFESELVLKIEKHLQKRYKTKQTFREVSAGYGVADLVVALPFVNQKPIDRDPITHFGTLHFYLGLGRSYYTFDQIVKKTPLVPPKVLRRYVSFLVKNNYLDKIDSRYKKIYLLEKHQPIRKIIAIEAKLSYCRSGVIQAKRYQYFADQSYLAVPKESIKNINIQNIIQMGIGIILFNQLTESAHIIKPKTPSLKPSRIYKIFAKETILRRMESRRSVSAF